MTPTSFTRKNNSSGHPVIRSSGIFRLPGVGYWYRKYGRIRFKHNRFHPYFILLHPSSSFFILLHPFLSITENKEGSEKGCAWQTFYDRNQLTCHMSHGSPIRNNGARQTRESRSDARISATQVPTAPPFTKKIYFRSGVVPLMLPNFSVRPRGDLSTEQDHGLMPI